VGHKRKQQQQQRQRQRLSAGSKALLEMFQIPLSKWGAAQATQNVGASRHTFQAYVG